MTDPRTPVLLYDGECSLCNGVVRFLLRRDKAGRLHFAPLQSGPGQAFLRSQGLATDNFDSLVFVPDWEDQAKGAFLLRTDGVIAALVEVGGIWRKAAWLRILPAFVRDAAYRLVAKTRRRLFGTYKPGPLADPSWERRFLSR